MLGLREEEPLSVTKTPKQPDTFEFIADKLLLRLDTTLPAEVHAIAPLVNRILDQVKETGCVAGKEFEVTLALQEALTNAVIHGAKEDPTKMVQVTASCDRARGILIVVRDPGTGFDVDSVPDPVMGERIFSSHGRGIFLINRLMDEVRFKRGGTEIHMRKK
jgi:serine/threonine-protein kinase RsbW